MKVKEVLVKLCDTDGHQDHKHSYYCIYHDGDSLIMHLFMCALTIGVNMLNENVTISEKFGESKVSEIVVNMFIGMTHDIGKYFCTFKDVSRNFLGFPFHGQGSASFLLNVLSEKQVNTELGLSFDECYKICLVSNFHMDWYHSKKDTVNYEEIMALARFFGKDIIKSLYFLCVADNLAKITKDGVSDRKFPTYETLLTHAKQFLTTIQKPITMCEMKNIVSVEKTGVLVSVLNTSNQRSVLLPNNLLRHRNTKVISEEDDLKNVKDYLDQGKIVIVNADITLEHRYASLVNFGISEYLKINLIYSNGIQENTLIHFLT